MFGNISKSKLNEEEKFAPLSIYALSKASAFHICQFYRMYLIFVFMVLYFLIMSQKEEL